MVESSESLESTLSPKMISRRLTRLNLLGSWRFFSATMKPGKSKMIKENKDNLFRLTPTLGISLEIHKNFQNVSKPTRYTLNSLKYFRVTLVN
jgi:hypothetical protein